LIAEKSGGKREDYFYLAVSSKLAGGIDGAASEAIKGRVSNTLIGKKTTGQRGGANRRDHRQKARGKLRRRHRHLVKTRVLFGRESRYRSKNYRKTNRLPQNCQKRLEKARRGGGRGKNKKMTPTAHANAIGCTDVRIGGERPSPPLTNLHHDAQGNKGKKREFTLPKQTLAHPARA